MLSWASRPSHRRSRTSLLWCGAGLLIAFAIVIAGLGEHLAPPMSR